METIMSVCLGIGLSAACGFRIFVPLLAMSIASLSGHLTLATGFDWIGTYPALITFSIATALEVAGYYIPWVDNFLDTLATPAAIIAGTVVSAALVTDMSPMLKWTLAIIGGGGAAGLVQGTTVVARAVSTAGSGGLANPLFATIELGSSIFTSIIALIAPLLIVILLVVAAFLVPKKLWARKGAAQPAPSPSPL